LIDEVNHFDLQSVFGVRLDMRWTHLWRRWCAKDDSRICTSDFWII